MIEKDIVDVVIAFQAGSRDAFASLVSRYQNLVTSVALARTGDVQRSEDIAQQAFLIAWQKQDELESPERFAAWLKGITNNLARNEVRLKSNRNRSSTCSIEFDTEPSIPTPADASTIQAEQNELLWSTLEQIPEDYREPIILFYREGQSVASVAEQLGLSADAVKQRLSRGRQMMKKEIEEMVEKMLFETRPKEAFCASVMTALPAALGSKVAAIAATKAAAAAGGKSIAAKLTGIVATGAAAGIIGAVLGTFGGILGAWIGVQQGIKRATSEKEKELHYWMLGASTLLSLSYAGGMILLVLVLKQSPIFTAGIITINIGFVLTLIAIVTTFTTRQRSLHKLYGTPKIYEEQATKEITSTQLRVNALGGVFGAWTWIVLLFGITRSWTLMIASLAIFALFTCYTWLKAPLQSDRLQQTTFAANVCLGSTIIQSLLLFVGYFFDLYGTATQYQNMPFWALGIFVPIFGFVMYAFLKYVGKKQHQANLLHDKKNPEQP